MEIRNKVIKHELYDWRKFKFIQGPGFKEFPSDAAARLRESMIRNNLIATFKVWQHGKDVYCLDGYHRCKVLKDLEASGHTVPDKLPCEFIECADRTEAAKLVLVYSSQYAQITKDSLGDFVTEFDLDIDALGEELHIDFARAGLDEGEQDAGPETSAEYPIVPRFSERYDYVVIFCKNDIDSTNLFETMKLRTEKSSKNSTVGVGRVLTYERFMELWKGKTQ